jgi:hypothetical protein
MRPQVRQAVGAQARRQVPADVAGVAPPGGGAEPSLAREPALEENAHRQTANVRQASRLPSELLPESRLCLALGWVA